MRSRSSGGSCSARIRCPPGRSACAALTRKAEGSWSCHTTSTCRGARKRPIGTGSTLLDGSRSIRHFSTGPGRNTVTLLTARTSILSTTKRTPQPLFRDAEDDVEALLAKRRVHAVRVSHARGEGSSTVGRRLRERPLCKVRRDVGPRESALSTRLLAEHPESEKKNETAP